MTYYNYTFSIKDQPYAIKACTPVITSPKYYECEVGGAGSGQTQCYKPATYSGQSAFYYSSLCESKPPMVAKLVVGSHDGEVCLDGCIYAKGATVPDSYSLGDSPAKVVTLATAWNANGAVCHSSGPLPPPKSDPECLQQGSLTQCIKPDGSHCVTASTGKQFCWGKNDNEPTKDDGVDYANRGQNGPAAPPTAPPSNGGPWGPPQNCVPMSSVIGGYTRNYTVCGGTSVPPGTNPPKPPTNQPPAPCDPAKGPCGGTSSGGDDCSAPPASTGDPLLAAVIKQSWYVRCGKSKADADGDGQPDWTKPGSSDYTETGPDNEPEEVATLNLSTSLLDTSGMIGGGSCPNIGAIDIAGLATVSVDAEPWWCPMISLMRSVVLMMAAFTSLKLLMGGS